MKPLSLEPKLRIIFLAMTALAILFVLGIYFIYFSAPGGPEERFIVPRGANQEEVIQQLKADGFIKSATGFILAYNIVNPGKGIVSGGYVLDKNENIFSIANKFANPKEKWIVVFEGVRKEEIAEILAETFIWNNEEKQRFLSYSSPKMFGLTEGVYFPDTYLIPVDETGDKVAERMVNRLNEKIAPYSIEFTTANVKTDTAIKIASIVQREAANAKEMPLIAGILWNRLEDDMKLDIDATVQYARGDIGKGYWAPIKSTDKNIDSPYNTYKNVGVPPQPISNPGLDAILAVLKPDKTECFYYLHDSEKEIHCAETYEKHLENIEEHLKS